MKTWESRLKDFEQAANNARSKMSSSSCVNEPHGIRELNKIILLQDSLELAVPLKIAELWERGGPSAFERRTLHRRTAILGERGNILMIRNQDGRADSKASQRDRAEAFNALVWGLAVAAFIYGEKGQSFTFLGRDYAENVACAMNSTKP